MRKLAIGILVSAMAVPAMTAPAAAQRYDGDRYERRDDRQDRRWERRDNRQDRRWERRDDRRDRRWDRRYDRRTVYRPAPQPPVYYSRYYDNRGYYNGPVWRGDGGRYYCHRSDGTTGVIVGGLAGAVIGSAFDRPGESTGALIGGILGAVIGSSAGDNQGRRCR